MRNAILRKVNNPGHLSCPPFFLFKSLLTIFYLFYILITYSPLLPLHTNPAFLLSPVPPTTVHPHPLLLSLCLEKPRPPMGVNKTRLIKLRQYQAIPLHQGWTTATWGITSQHPAQGPGADTDSTARTAPPPPKKKPDQITELSCICRGPRSVPCRVLSCSRVHELPEAKISCLCGFPCHD